MLLVGNDFSYVSKAIRAGQHESTTFEMLDSLMNLLNRYSEKLLGFKVQTKYSTPSEYFKVIENEIYQGLVEIPTIVDVDFSHYDENIRYLHSYFKGVDKVDYWTGYYSNRPSLKSTIYRAFNFYKTASIFTHLSLAE